MATKLGSAKAAGALALAVVLCSVGTTVGLLLAADSPVSMYGFKDLQSQGTWKIGLLTMPLAMLLGIFGNAVWLQLGEDNADVNAQPIGGADVIKRALGSRGFLRAVVVSPIVFAAIYALVRDQPDPLVSHLLAFENGFFWNTVLEGRRPKVSAPKPVSNPA